MAEKKEPKLKKARVLVDCVIEEQRCRCNAIVEFAADVIAKGEKDGLLDSNPAAVAAAQG